MIASDIIEYFIPRRSGTHADPMAAIGLADLLDPVGDSRIGTDLSRDAFVVRVPETVDVAQLGQSSGYRHLRPNEKTPVPEGLSSSEVFDYPQQREAVQRYREAAKKQKRSATGDVAEAIEQDAPDPDYYLYQTLNSLQGDDAANRARRWVSEKNPADWQDTLRRALTDLSSGRVPKVDLELDLVQLFSPHAAKGYARLKPDSTARGDKTKDAWAEPFLEWLRFRGYFAAACTYGVGPKSEHVRIIYPVPADIGYRALHSVVRSLRKVQIFGSTPKIDCLSTLRLAGLLIRHSLEMGRPRRPHQSISGVTITHYQSLGQAKAVTSVEELAIPDWFALETKEQGSEWLDTLAEHERSIRSLRDENSDELGLIIAYRKYLEQRGPASIVRLLDFLEGYGIFIVRQRGQNTWYHRQFTTQRMEAIVAESRYSDILENPGFRKIAAALRSSTVSAQSRKRNKQDYREIRYDILPELKRKRSLPDPDHLVEAITAFVTSFNAESAKRLENTKATGTWRVTTEELASFLGLFDDPKNKGSVIGAMLSAYATCREIKDPEESTETDQDAANTTVQEK